MFTSTSLFVTRKASNGRRGFSLTELAIVLGVAGIVFAGLWGIVGFVKEGIHRNQAVEEIMLIVGNIRGFYMGQQGVPNANMTDDLIRKGVIPADYARKPVPAVGLARADLPWGSSGVNGTLLAGGGLVVNGGAAPGLVFTLTLNGLKKESCLAVVSDLILGQTPSGLINFRINGGPTLTPPTTVPALRTRCNAGSAPASGATVELTYNLRMQGS